MKSEELEVSLRTEFENYLKNVLADVKQEVSQLQEKIEVEAEKHKSQLEEVFKNALKRVDSDVQLDDGFKDAVMEHLRLAKDEGARITVTAMEEAENMEINQASEHDVSFFAAKMRDAVNDIAEKQSQAEILKALISHCEEYTPRGAFFIIKNEHFVGWRTFGKDKGETEETIREVFFPISEQSLLSEANKSGVVVSNSTAKGDDEALYLQKLGFIGAEKMYAVPLFVRGRGVAVLYTDSGNGNSVNIESIETLSKVASLTVELLASAKSTRSVPEERTETKAQTDEKIAKPETSPLPEISNVITPITQFTSPAIHEEKIDIEEIKGDSVNDFEADTFVSDDDSIETVSAKEETTAFTTDLWGKPEVETNEFSSDTISIKPEKKEFDDYSSNTISIKPASSFEFESNTSFDSASAFETTKPETFVTKPLESESFTQNEVSNFEDDLTSFEAETPSFDKTSFGNAFESEKKPAVEEIVQPVSTAPAKSRFSERNVDLPINVADDERRLHNDARRFARLLVSEIKLYNEQKVKEGRDANDLYERLKEAIDRSREMYDKRVQPPVAQKFDYFHYEIVNTLAEGEQNKLGESYPGASV